MSLYYSGEVLVGKRMWYNQSTCTTAITVILLHLWCIYSHCTVQGHTGILSFMDVQLREAQWLAYVTKKNDGHAKTQVSYSRCNFCITLTHCCWTINRLGPNSSFTYTPVTPSHPFICCCSMPLVWKLTIQLQVFCCSISRLIGRW